MKIVLMLRRKSKCQDSYGAYFHLDHFNGECVHKTIDSDMPWYHVVERLWPFWPMHLHTRTQLRTQVKQHVEHLGVTSLVCRAQVKPSSTSETIFFANVWTLSHFASSDPLRCSSAALSGPTCGFVNLY